MHGGWDYEGGEDTEREDGRSRKTSKGQLVEVPPLAPQEKMLISWSKKRQEEDDISKSLDRILRKRN